ncbi:hypothetical protein [Ovoidimarina sediminis]|uniref:hypothetical protein n=1 Tax=Ovoidimarina sediminis TaxID=3079856 RepID=UPI002913E561|nr:hypothetical protein [Rhodophyticola sp. MJ-SS7]MDU8945614.1 hypothetical protein [Rhodophyticola sp. MJ-SS7]
MKFNKETGRWEDKGGPKGMGASAFRNKEQDIARECHRRWKALEEKRLKQGLDSGELDQYGFLAQMAFDYLENALRPTIQREEKEKRGSRKGVENRTLNREDSVADRLDELRAIYNPSMSAEWHRTKFNRVYNAELKLRTIQRDLKKIRD